MNIGAVSASGRSNSHVGGSQDQVIMEIKTKIKEVKQEIQKVNRSRDLTDDQKKAKREMLQTQLDKMCIRDRFNGHRRHRAEFRCEVTQQGSTGRRAKLAAH